MSAINPYKANKDFKDRSKAIFLSALKTKFPNYVAPHISPFKYFIRGAAFGVAFMAIVGGISVYADQRNVGPESLLYPLKRSSEAVNLALTTQTEKSAFHLKLANRRLIEIKTIRKSNPASPQVDVLTKDLSEEVKNSIETIKDLPDVETASSQVSPSAIQEAKVSQSAAGFSVPSVGVEETSTQEISSSDSPLDKIADDKHRTLCESWRDIFDSREEGINIVIDDDQKISEKFEKKCSIFLGGQTHKSESAPDSSSTKEQGDSKGEKRD